MRGRSARTVNRILLVSRRLVERNGDSRGQMERSQVPNFRCDPVRVLSDLTDESIDFDQHDGCSRQDHDVQGNTELGNVHTTAISFIHSTTSHKGHVRRHKGLPDAVLSGSVCLFGRSF